MCARVCVCACVYIMEKGRKNAKMAKNEKKKCVYVCAFIIAKIHIYYFTKHIFPFLTHTQ